MLVGQFKPRSLRDVLADENGIMSQPAELLSHRDRLLWLQKRRTTGLWVQCDQCSAWRHLSHVLDSHELPKEWYCKMNPDKSMADCSVTETPIHIYEEEDLIHSEYSAGSLVWAHLPGYPWWPAMVDDCPDTEQYYWLDGLCDIPTHYNVVFFDAVNVTRAWIAPNYLKPYSTNNNFSKLELNSKVYKKRLEEAIKQANDAMNLNVSKRLEKYSFINRYNGPILTPKKVHKKDLIKYQKQLKRKFNIEFPLEEPDHISDNKGSSSDRSADFGNKIILGTPKGKKQSKINDTAIMATSVNETGDTGKASNKRTKNNSKNTVLSSESIPNNQSLYQTLEKVVEDSSGSFEVQKSKTKDNKNTDISVHSKMKDNIDKADSKISTFTFDNDTSVTYKPDKEVATETQTLFQDSQEGFDIPMRTSSKNSDDFDF